MRTSADNAVAADICDGSPDFSYESHQSTGIKAG